MIKILASLLLVSLSYCYLGNTLQYQLQPNNLQLYNNRIYQPNQYAAFSNAMSVNDAIKLQQLNAARDSMMGGTVGNIRRNLKSEIDKIVAAEAMKLGNYGAQLNYGSSYVL